MTTEQKEDPVWTGDIVSEAMANRDLHTDKAVVDLFEYDLKQEEERTFLVPKKAGAQRYGFATEWPIRQLCRMAHVPFSFYKKCSAGLNNDIMKEWLPIIKPDDAKVILNYRQLDGEPVVRGVLPLSWTDVPNQKLWEQLNKELPLKDYDVQLFNGSMPDDENTHIRLISKDQFEVAKDPFHMGFSVQMSDLGGNPLTLDVILFRQTCKNGAIVTYANHSYLTHKYVGLQAEDLQQIFSNVAKRGRGDQPEILKRIQKAMDEKMTMSDLRDMFKHLRNSKGVSKALMDDVEKHVYTLDNPTLFSLADRITLKAQAEKAVRNRLRNEALGGQILNLDLASAA